MANANLKEKIREEAKALGMVLTGFANVERWEEAGEIPRAFFPQSIWPWCKTVISMVVPMPLPILETTPSILYGELYITSNRLLDEAAYRLGLFLNSLGHRAFFFPRDCYGDISVLVKNPDAAFSHVVAGKYAGLGTFGFNHTLITPQFGPRIRLVSVLTDAELDPDPLLTKELCKNCGLCQRKCPTNAFTPRADSLVAIMDRHKCAEYHQKLRDEMRAPCGICTLVCPVGEDRKLYGKSAVSKEGVEHVQSYGSQYAVRNL